MLPLWCFCILRVVVGGLVSPSSLDRSYVFIRLKEICLIISIISCVSRCSDLMSGVTKVLQSVGVSCCTIQPEFPSLVSSPGCDASLVVHREDPSLPPLLACSLACGKDCAGSMCCSPLEEEARSLLAPPAGESTEEAQTLVVENTFL